MKTKAIYALVCWLLGLVFVSSCDSLRQEVNPDRLTKEPEKVVVSCFISPQDTVLAASVTRSQPVLGVANRSFLDIQNAVVTLSDGSRSITLRYGSTPQSGFQAPGSYYSARASELPIVAGRTYTLRVEVPDGRRVEATCTVPENVVINSVLLDSATVNRFDGPTKEYYARVRWRDPAGQSDFYRAAGDNAYEVIGQIYRGGNQPPRDTVYQSGGSWYFDNGALVSDAGNDGQLLASERGRLAVGYSYTAGRQRISPPKGPLHIYLLHVDENYYRYHDAVQRQNRVDGNPFAEPVLIPTNIQGGLGCFGAYNRSMLTMELK